MKNWPVSPHQRTNDQTMNFDSSKITAIIDTREQHPWDLALLRVVRAALDVGDVSVVGMESLISLERKSLLDLVSCCGRQRPRFQRELDRLRGWPVSAVIVESTWSEIEAGEWQTGRMKIGPNHVLGSLTSWISQNHTIILAPRPMAERICRSILTHAARHRFNEVRNFITEQTERLSK